MTSPHSFQITPGVVREVDRNRAQDVAERLANYTGSAIRDGEMDDFWLVQIFRDHRLADTADLIEACRAFIIYDERDPTGLNAGIQLMADYNAALTKAHAAVAKATGGAA